MGRRTSKGMNLTERDRIIVRWIGVETGVATRAQVQEKFFGPGSRSRCQYRLTTLFRNRYLDRLPGRAPNAPAVYYVSPKNPKGMRLIRAGGVDAASVTGRPSGARLKHTLDLVSCRVRLESACVEMGYMLVRWLNERDLVPMMASTGIVPDAYFQVTRVAAGRRQKRSAFFLEVERSDKAERTLVDKFRRYGEFFYGGKFEGLFGARALRVLVLIGSDYGIVPERRVEKMASLAEQVGVTFLRFAPLVAFFELPLQEVMIRGIWRQPGESELASLFSRDD